MRFSWAAAAADVCLSSTATTKWNIQPDAHVVVVYNFKKDTRQKALEEEEEEEERGLEREMYMPNWIP